MQHFELDAIFRRGSIGRVSVLRKTKKVTLPKKPTMLDRMSPAGAGSGSDSESGSGSGGFGGFAGSRLGLGFGAGGASRDSLGLGGSSSACHGVVLGGCGWPGGSLVVDVRSGVYMVRAATPPTPPPLQPRKITLADMNAPCGRISHAAKRRSSTWPPRGDQPRVVWAWAKAHACLEWAFWEEA